MKDHHIYVRVTKTRGGSTAHNVTAGSYYAHQARAGSLVKMADLFDGAITLHITYQRDISEIEVQDAIAYWWSRELPTWDIGGRQRIILAPIDVEAAAGQGGIWPAAELVKHSLMK